MKLIKTKAKLPTKEERIGGCEPRTEKTTKNTKKQTRKK